MKSVSVIGLGGIGRPIAERLLSLGFTLTVCDVREEAMATFAARGVRTTQSPAGCASSDAVIVLVANDAQVEAVTLGEKGLLEGVDATNPPIVLIMSTVLPATVRSISERMQIKQVVVYDAPVSGGIRGAIDGKLTILIGGAAADVEAVSGLLAKLGRNIFHCGPLGAGSTAKILNNLVSNANIYLMTEVLMVAKAIGVDRAWLTGVMEASAGRNWMTADYDKTQEFYKLNTADMPALIASVNITRKDLGLGLTLAADAGLDCPAFKALAANCGELSYEKLFSTWSALKE